MKRGILRHGAISILCLLAVVAVEFFVMPCHAEAKTKKITVTKTNYLDLTSNAKKYGVYAAEGLELKNFDFSQDTILSVSSSKPSVVKIKNQMMHPQKAGKAKITLEIKKKNGKKEKLSTNVVVQKWKTPVQTFKIGKRSFVSRYKTDNNAYLASQYPPNDARNNYVGKLQVKANKDWKLMSIQKKHYNWDTGKYKTTTLKNNKKYTFVPDDTIILTFKDVKTKFIRKCTLSIQ